MKEEKIPVSKVARVSEMLGTGLKVGGQYLKYYSQKAISGNQTRAELDSAVATELFSGFSKMKGSPLKLAQVLAMDTDILPRAITEKFQEAQYSVPPMSDPMARKIFKSNLGFEPEKVFDSFSAKAVRAASLGQVHEAWLNGKKVAVKIQYPGVGDSIISDLNLIKPMATRYLGLKEKEVEPYFNEIQTRLLEEVDYKKELETAESFKKACAPLKYVKIPEYYPELSCSKVITMEWMDGKHLREWMLENPSVEARTNAAQNLWDLYEYQAHVLRKLHADPHPGNFLFSKDGSVSVLDFGCIKSIDNDFYTDYFSLVDPGLWENQELTIRTLTRLGILFEADSTEKRQFLLKLFKRMILKMSAPYRQHNFYFNDPELKSEMMELFTEISAIREPRGSRHFLFINRTFGGLFKILQTLDVTIKTKSEHLNLA